MSNLSSPRAATPGTPRGAPTAAARFARSRVRALSFLVIGALILPALLVAFGLRAGRIDRRAVGVAVGVSTLIELLGVAQLVVRGRAMARAAFASAPKEIHFCRRSLGRLGPGTEPLLSGLRARGHTPVVRECLNCCQDCNLGMLVTRIDGTPMTAPDGDKLLGDLDALAADA